MRSMLGSLSVLLAVISTGHSLLCTQCAGSNSYPCNGDNITCPSDSVCGATYTLTGVGDAESIKSYARECVPRKECDMAGSISLLAGIKILLGRSCCYTDLCLPAQPKLPAVSTKLNGLVCPACVSEGSTWCNPNDGTLRCTGSETACLMQTVNLQGHSLLCTQCEDNESFKCEGGNITCPSDFVCGTTYTVNIVGSTEASKSYTRECVLRKECDFQGGISLLADIKILLGRSCCYTDLCIPAQPKLPAVSTKLNGLVCPACVSEDSTWCNPKDGTVRCTGSETACLTQTINMTGLVSLKTAVRGCATRRLCDLGKQTADTPGATVEVTHTCTSGAAILYSGFSCAVIVMILLSHARSCKQCVSLLSTSCDGPSITCPSDNVCGASHTETTAGGAVVTTNYVRGCVPKNQCNFKGSLSVINNVMNRISSTCCDTDNCTPDLPTYKIFPVYEVTTLAAYFLQLSVPAVSTRLNGLVCRTCFSADTDSCYTKDSMQCTGDENMCLLQTISITGKIVSLQTALRGCATKSLCDLGRQTEEIAGHKVDTRYICTSGTAGLYSGLTLSLIVILITMFS
uniref:UPAR/Ly6 domain-containing protein n=1 Tax=Leptobrachium leishanense TaxID=445787 RepID=A0A8C5QUQ4_9ANUR